MASLDSNVQAVQSALSGFDHPFPLVFRVPRPPGTSRDAPFIQSELGNLRLSQLF